MPDWQHIFFPDRFNCIFCDAELQERQPDGICNNCRANTRTIPGDEKCLKCGTSLPTMAELCLNCKENARLFDLCRAPFAFEDAPARAVLRLKFNNAQWLAKYFAYSMFLKFQEEKQFGEQYEQHGQSGPDNKDEQGGQSNPDNKDEQRGQPNPDNQGGQNLNCSLIIPVPLSPQRQKQRGFNQAELIAAHISTLLMRPLNTQAVEKIKETEAQTGIGSARIREKNLHGAYKVTDKSAVKGRRILLIDDVITTGSTLNEVAKTLKKAGAESVVCLTYAATVNPLFRTDAGSENV